MTGRPVDERLAAAPVARVFAEAVRPVAGVLACYAGGSLATADYRPGLSDLDLVAVVQRPVVRGRRTALGDLHRRFEHEHGDAAAKLHCAYVPAGDLTDVGRRHLWWAHNRLLRRPFSGIGRGELLQGGITVYGPPPARLIPALTAADLARAARGELLGYWAGAVRRRRVWRTDLHVDLGLTTLSRAAVTIDSGRLISKREAISRLPALGVPPALVDEITRRRAGEPVTLTEEQVSARAELVRQLMRTGLARLLG